jgi:hypothetical protein
MRTYTSKVIRRESERNIFAAKEGRDAIVDEVHVVERYALIRIQGSDTLIHAPWAENWEQAPSFLRVGNAVRIYHPQGNPNKIEITGNANSIPTPVGSISVLPTQPSTEDAIISGCVATAGSAMILTVTAGTYRVDNVVYSLVSDDVTISTAPTSPDYRVDMISVGASGVIQYTVGTPHATDPANPTLPSDEVLIAYVVVPYEETVILQGWIGQGWTELTLVAFIATMDTFEMIWSYGADNIGTITLRNQYGKLLVGSHGVTVTIDSGNGTIDSVYPTKIYNITTGTKTFTYIRGMIDAATPPGDPPYLDASPTIHCYVTAQTDFTMSNYILLYDSTGDMML